ncbi:MAG: RND transporter [Magnetococcales bacterium]|nr:RND transporter [Magnetococcales bacterium]
MLSSFSHWIDQLPWSPLLLAALLMALAPFVPEPHLWEKLKMLAGGTLSRPIDIFDLCMHATPLLLVLFKLWRQLGGAATVTP